MAFLAIASGASALVCAGLIWLLWPVLRRYALARPNARSSHSVPTPQGGGIAVLAATLLVASVSLGLTASGSSLGEFAAPALAAVGLAIVGVWDDIRPLPTLPRLLVQIACVAVVVLWADPARILPETVP